MSDIDQLLAGLTTGTDLPAAVTVGDQSLSWEELLGAGAAVADRIGGVETVAIGATASLETIVAVVGSLLAGVPAVPVPPDSGPVERAHILEDSAAKIWLGAAPEDVTLEAIPVDSSARSGTTWPEPTPESMAFVMYTSGTTGPPKGVRISRRAVAASLDGLADAWQWTPDDHLVHGLPLFHVHGLILGVLGPLRIGSSVQHTVRPRPEAYAAANGTLYFGVPTVWSRVCADEASARALGSARLLVSGSAPLPTPVFERLAKLTGAAPIERYGMTETLITVSTRADGERRPGWVGTAIDGVRTRIVGEAGQPVPADGVSIGQLQLAGPTLFDGYLNLPDETARAMTDDGWFKTGDIAAHDAGGFHRIVGRESTDLIKTGGYRVGAGEIEAVLLGHPGVRESAVVGEPDADLGQRIVAYVVGDGLDARAISQLVADTLSIHKRPREVWVVESLPRNAMGKIQKKLLIPPTSAP